MITTMIEVIGVGPSRPSRLLPQPHWNTATSTPYAAPMESRFISAAFSGTTTERKTSISRRNGHRDHGADEQRERLRQLGVEVVGRRGDPGDVDVARDGVADPVDRGGGRGVGRAGRRQGGEDRGATVGGDLLAADRGDRRAARRGRGPGRVRRPGVTPGASRSTTTSQRCVDPGAEALGEQVVGLPVGGLGGGVAGGREGGLHGQGRCGDDEEGDHRAQQVGPGAGGDAVAEAPPGGVLGWP